MDVKQLTQSAMRPYINDYYCSGTFIAIERFQNYLRTRDEGPVVEYATRSRYYYVFQLINKLDLSPVQMSFYVLWVRLSA